MKNDLQKPFFILKNPHPPRRRSMFYEARKSKDFLASQIGRNFLNDVLLGT